MIQLAMSFDDEDSKSIGRLLTGNSSNNSNTISISTPLEMTVRLSFHAASSCQWLSRLTLVPWGGTSHGHLDWPRLSYREQFKEGDEEADRGNDGKTTLKSGLALNGISY